MAVVDRNILRAGRLRAAVAARRAAEGRHQRGHRDRQEVRDRRSRAASSTACWIGSRRELRRPPREPRRAVRDPVGRPRQPRGAAGGPGGRRGPADAVLCLGDIVGYGADPLACVELIAERAVAIVGGNHEHGGRRPARPRLVQPLRARRGSVDPRAPRRRPPRVAGRAAARARRSATPRSCTPRPRSRTSGTTSSPPRTASTPSRRSRPGCASWATPTVPGAWSLGSCGPEHERGAASVRSSRGVATSSTSAVWGSRATAIRARPTRIWDVEARRIDLAPRRLRRGDGARRKIVAAGLPQFLADRLAVGRLSRVRGAWRRAALLVGAASALALAFPRHRLGMGSLGRADAPAASSCSAATAARRLRLGLAVRHGLLPRPAALAQLHVLGLQRHPVAADVGPDLALAGVLRALRRRSSPALVVWLAAASLRRLGAGAAPFSGSAASGSAGTSWAASRGACSATRSTCELPVIQIAELGGVYAVSFVLVAANAALAGLFVLAAGAALARGGDRDGDCWPRRWASARGGSRQPPAGARGARGGSCSRPSSSRSSSIPRHAARDPGHLPGADAARRRASGRSSSCGPRPRLPPSCGGTPSSQRTLDRSGAQLRLAAAGRIDRRERWRPPAATATARSSSPPKGSSARYDKIQLVPFGEYVPLSALIGFVRGWAEFIADLEPGSRAVVFLGPARPVRRRDLLRGHLPRALFESS